MPLIPELIEALSTTPSGRPSPLPYLIIAALAIFLLLAGLTKLIAPWFSPLSNLPHPKNESLLFGNMLEIFREPSGVVHERWEGELGQVFAYRQILGGWRLCTTDPRALSHILSHAYAYPKPANVQRDLARTLGAGLLVAEGDAHKRQRRIMNPSFSPQQIRDLAPIFWDKSEEMARMWVGLIDSASSSEENARGGVEIDVTRWIPRATLDIIGLAGFGYAFESLTDASNELARAFTELLNMQRPDLFALLFAFVPVLRLLPVKRNRIERQSSATMRRVGLELVARKKAAVRQTMDGIRKEKDIERHMLAGRDLLTALVRANMAADVPPSQRLDDEEVLAQISTFLLAGHETTSTALTWALYALSLYPDVQKKLRDELAAVPSTRPDADELNALPYLDAFVREVLRFYSPVPGTVRLAGEDDTIPVSRPYRDTYGNEQTSIPIRKGDGIFLPIRQVNRSPHLWGADAGTFSPDRWLSPLPEPASQIPGIYSHVLSFLGGPRACIGYRFSLLEIKVLLFVLVRGFEYEFEDPKMEFEARSTIVSRVHVKGRGREGPCLPLRVRKVEVSK